MKTEKLKYLWEVSAGQRGPILLSCFTGILEVLFALAFIYTSKLVIDIATGVTDGDLTHAAALTIVLLIAQLLCDTADTWISTRMQIETGNALRHRLFARLLLALATPQEGCITLSSDTQVSPPDSCQLCLRPPGQHPFQWYHPR